MDVTNDDYIRLLSALLPPGPAWSASDPSIAGAAPSLTRVHQRADALMRELDPRTTTELINRWERLCGLPDECIPAGTQTLRQRQQRLDAKVNLAGGINENFYLAQLAALGRPDATITRYDKSTFTCSSACTDAVNAPEWRYYWQVNMPAATNTTWMTCGDPCDSALRIWGDTVVECVLNKLCPSHTYVIFKYLNDFPFAFPSACYGMIVSHVGHTPSGAGILSASAITSNQFRGFSSIATAANAVLGRYIAIGV